MSSHLALKLEYINKINTHILEVELKKSLFQFCLTITEPLFLLSISRKFRPCLSASSIKREIRHVHVVVEQKRAEKCTKKHGARAKFLFC